MANKTIYRQYGKIINGKRIYYNESLHNQVITELEGQEFEEITKLKHKKVSLDTHGYYRGGIIKECLNYEMFRGWEEDDIHEFFANEFLGYRRVLILHKDDGTIEQHPVPKITSTSSLNQKEMNEFIEKVIAWLAQHNIIIKSPEEYYLGKYATTYNYDDSAKKESDQG